MAPQNSPPPMYPDVKKWSVESLCLDPKNPGIPRISNLEVPTNERSITMPGSKAHSGMPIDASLALQFIRNFYENYQISITSTQRTQDFIAANDSDGLSDSHKKSSKLHEEIIKLTYGMTMEKDIALRVLSQPRCEGLRFYLCAKDPVGDDVHVSLIAVGVDKDGYDLHYNKPKSTGQNDKITANADNVATSSLTVEYVTPPYDNVTGNPLLTGIAPSAQAEIQQDFLDRFVLLNMAKTMPSTANAISTLNTPNTVDQTSIKTAANSVTITDIKTASVS